MNESVGKALSMHEFGFQVPAQGPPVFLVLKRQWQGSHQKFCLTHFIQPMSSGFSESPCLSK